MVSDPGRARPGCAIGYALLPLLAHQLWTAQHVVAVALRLAAAMNKNVRLLNSVQLKLIELGKDPEVYDLTQVAARFDGKRWGVRLCGFAVDATFERVMYVRLGLAAAALGVVMLLVGPLLAWFKQTQQERARHQAERLEARVGNAAQKIQSTVPAAPCTRARLFEPPPHHRHAPCVVACEGSRKGVGRGGQGPVARRPA